MSLLSARGVTAHYGEFEALSGVSIELGRGDVVAIIGPNGAGKSTLLKCLAGWAKPTAGEILLDGKSISPLPSNEVVRRGIALVPEGRRLFPSLSVEENLQIGAVAGRPGPWTLERVYKLFPVLAERKTSPGTALSGGQQQMVAIGRALMSNPSVLLCDELSLGLAPIVVGDIYAMLPEIRAEGVSVLIVEQDVARARAVARYLYCLQEGIVDLEGEPSALTHEAITAAYFGVHA